MTTSHVLGNVDLFASAVNGSSAGPCRVDGRVNLIHAGWEPIDHVHSRSVSMRIAPVPPDASSGVALTLRLTPQRPDGGVGVESVVDEVPHAAANAVSRTIKEAASRTPPRVITFCEVGADGMPAKLLRIQRERTAALSTIAAVSRPEARGKRIKR